jgi:hypothetical protein
MQISPLTDRQQPASQVRGERPSVPVDPRAWRVRAEARSNGLLGKVQRCHLVDTVSIFDRTD